MRSKGCLSNKTALAMIFKLAEAAERSWRRLNGHNQLPKIILGIEFTDGIEVVRSQAQTAAPDPFRHQDSAIARTQSTSSNVGVFGARQRRPCTAPPIALTRALYTTSSERPQSPLRAGSR